MFNPFKIYKKYKNSSTWGEFFASYFIDLDAIYKQLEGKTETQQIEILKRALEDQQSKVGELAEELTKHKEQVEELLQENQKLKEQLKDQGKVESNDLSKLREAVKGLTDTTERSKKTFTEFRTKIEVIKKVK